MIFGTFVIVAFLKDLCAISPDPVPMFTSNNIVEGEQHVELVHELRAIHNPMMGDSEAILGELSQIMRAAGGHLRSVNENGLDIACCVGFEPGTVASSEEMLLTISIQDELDVEMAKQYNGDPVVLVYQSISFVNSDSGVTKRLNGRGTARLQRIAVKRDVSSTTFAHEFAHIQGVAYHWGLYFFVNCSPNDCDDEEDPGRLMHCGDGIGGIVFPSECNKMRRSISHANRSDPTIGMRRCGPSIYPTDAGTVAGQESESLCSLATSPRGRGAFPWDILFIAAICFLGMRRRYGEAKV